MDDVRFKTGLQEIKMIRKENLSERELCTRIMEALYKIGDMHQLDEEEFVELRDALLALGCMSIEDLRAEAEKRGKDINGRLSFETGSIITAYCYFAQFITKRESADYALEFANSGYEYAPAYMWLKASKRKLDISSYFKRKSEDLRVYLEKEKKKESGSSKAEQGNTNNSGDENNGSDPRYDD